MGRPLVGAWSGALIVHDDVPPDPTLDFGFEIPPSINGAPVAGGVITIDGGVTFGTYESANYFLLLDGAQVEAGQGPFTIPTSWLGGMLTPLGVLRKGTQVASEPGSEVGPVVATFPSFAPPYHGAAAALGTASGENFANAFPYQNTNIFAQAVNINGGGQIRYAAHLGNYTARTVAVNFGGTVEAPCVIQGVNAAFDPTLANIVGIRQDPWTLGGAIGGEVFKVGRANHLQMRDLNLENCGVGIRFSAPIDDVLIEDVVISNARRGIENGHSTPETSAPVTNAVIRNLQMPDGFSKQGIRFEYNSFNILVTGNSAEDPSIWDAKYQGPDGGCYGADIRGTTHDITFRFLHIYRCSSQQLETDFWDGDGIAAQTGCYGFLIDQCLLQGHADGGVDLKGGALAPHEVTNTRLFYNTWNLKAWDRVNFRGIKSREPHKRGGTNATHHIHFVARRASIGGSHYIIENASFSDDKTSGIAFQVDNIIGDTGPFEATITIINSSYSGGMDPNWDVVPGVTIIGAFIQGPVCNTPPTIVWEDEAGNPASPAVGNYVKCVTQIADWTGAATFEYQWRLDTEWVTFATGQRMLATSDAVGKIIDCYVTGIHTNGLHEGAKISDPASPLLDLVVPNGYGFLEHSPQGTELPALVAGGFADQERFDFTLTDNDGNRVQPGAANSPIFQVGATDSAFEDNPRELEATMTDSLAEFDPIIKPIPYLVFKSFDELTRLISYAPAGDRSGIGHFGNAAPIQDLPELLADLVTSGEVGCSIRILGGGPGYFGFGSLVVPTTPADEAHRIEIFGCTAGGLPSGDTGKELTFDFTTPADQMSTAERYASFNFNGFNKDSYTCKIFGSRTPWTPPKWCIFRTGTSGLSDFSDGAAFTGYSNLASASFSEGQQLTYRAILPGTSHFEDGTAIYLGGVLVRPTTMRASSNAGAKVNFPSAPDIFIRQLTWANSFNGNILFDFRNSAQFLTFHHFWLEKFGRAAFLFDAPSSTGSNNISLENMYCRNNQNVWWQDDTFGGGDPTPITLHDLSFKHILAEGYSKDFALFHGDTHDILFEHCFLNSYWQDGDAYAKGITMDGTAHGLRCYRVISLNTIDTTGASGAPKNGDGIVAEGPCYDIDLEESAFAGNCQGVDLKGLRLDDAGVKPPIRATRCVFFDNQNNFKNWGVGAEPAGLNVATDCIFHGPYKHATGGGSTDNIECPPNSRSQWVFDGCSFDRENPASLHMNVNNQRSRLKFIDSALTHCDEVNGRLIADTSQGDATFINSTIDGVLIGLEDISTGLPVFALSQARGASNNNVISGGTWPVGIKKGQYCLMVVYRKTNTVPLSLYLQSQGSPDIDGWEIISELSVGTSAIATLLGRLMQGEMRGPWACGFTGTTGTHGFGAGFWNSVLRVGQAWEGLASITGAGIGDIPWPAITTLGADRMGVHLAGLGNDNARGTVPAGWTQRLSQGISAGDDTGFIIDEKAIPLIGTEPGASRTQSNPNWIAWSLGLKPAE